MQLNREDDPRTRWPYQKLRRKECERLARIHGVSEIDPNMPAKMMQKILARHGIPVPDAIVRRPLYTNGKNVSYDPERPVNAPSTSAPVEADADAILEQQWRAQNNSALPEEMPIGDLRKLCKERGIELRRTDKRVDMVAKLNGQNPSQ